MTDLSNLSNLVQIITAIAGAIGSSLMALWKFVIIPNRNFREKMINDLKDLDEKIEDLEVKITDVRDDAAQSLAEFKQDLQHEVTDVRKDYTNLSKEMNQHIIKTDAKNEKLLDLIIRFFSK